MYSKLVDELRFFSMDIEQANPER